jgi:hypothetical protein
MNMLSNAFASTASLDFESIKAKLVHKRSGKGWTMEHANAVEREYRRFLVLMKAYPNELTAPSLDVDRFWHQHILDTVKYARDCEAVFGYFLHHYPYLGLGLAGDDSAARLHAGDRMRELYEEAFGEPYQATATGFCTQSPENHAFCTVDAQAFCTTTVDAQAFCTTTVDAQAFCTTTVEAQAFCTTTVEPQAFCTSTIEPGLLHARIAARDRKDCRRSH